MAILDQDEPLRARLPPSQLIRKDTGPYS